MSERVPVPRYDPYPWLPYTIDLLDGEQLEDFIETQHQKGVMA